jgi:hypothetical protein
VALALNNSGKNVAIGDVMSLTLQSQFSAAYEYKANPVLLVWANAPSVDSLSICVAVEPIELYKIGRVAISGVVLANVDTTQVGGAQIDRQSSYPSSITGRGIASSRSFYLSVNENGVLCPSESGPALLVSAPINANGIHAQPETQPELCIVRLGNTPPTQVRYGIIGGGDAWALGTTRQLFDINRNKTRTSSGVGSAVRGDGGFVAWNNFRELTNAGSGDRLVCCALDLNMEWQVVCVAPNSAINEVVVDVKTDAQGRVSEVVKQKLY